MSSSSENKTHQQQYCISGIPAINSGDLIGIVTKTDIVRAVYEIV
ncbi:MAG TPA: hypothetical protein VFI70_10425 [Nitrososphaeraceae archaeon]|nr:hypothetical protein [Nitrososphaeraceae archaeon]